MLWFVQISASERRVLFTKWVGHAWDEISAKNKNTIIRSFHKCGISLPIDGSEDSEININGVEDYEVGSGDTSEDSGSDSDSDIDLEDDDPFANI